VNSKLHTISTKDGRKLRVTEAGTPEGVPVMLLHGTPGSAYLRDYQVENALEQGVRLMSYDRPGYGGSTPQPGRSVADAAEDLREIAKALELSRLLVWGHSGGGPHSLACAALLPELVAAVTCSASPAPYNAEGLDWFAGMGEDNIEEFGAALKGREQVSAFIEAAVPGMLQGSAADVIQELRSLLCQADVEVLTEHNVQQMIHSDREGILERRDGWIDDDMAMTKKWGFDLGQIHIPVLLIQGGQDLFVPFAHGEWLAARIPNVEARLLPEDGHLTISVRRIPEVFEWLLEKWK
jgi:pimeloyl-ACP methyl ester carboxylesterase